MIRAVIPALLVLCAAACSDDAAPLVASDIVIRPPLPGMEMAAGYLSLHNTGRQPVTITGVTSAQFGRVEMHETVIEDGVARMVELGALTLLPGSTIDFSPGGKHLMLMQPLSELDSVTLNFHAGDAVVLTVSAKPGE